MILEIAHLDVKPNQAAEFERAFRQAAPLIAATDGYISHQLARCIETPQRYVLLVQWETLAAHTVGFRQSERYPEWKKLLHHFYDPFPLVEHYEPVFAFEREI
jgi:heme-degrading monooxygenase HmoA